jgi:hypothetical protein
VGWGGVVRSEIAWYLTLTIDDEALFPFANHPTKTMLP